MKAPIGYAYDTDTPISASVAQELKKIGANAVGRYLQNLSQTEVKNIFSAGLKLWSIFETSPTSGAYFVAGKGSSDAQAAIQFAKSLGQPIHSTIYFTVDYDAPCADMPAILTYVKEAEVELSQAGYYTGVYGSYSVLGALHQAGLGGFLWQTSSWSNGEIFDLLWLYQNKHNLTAGGISVDMDLVYSDPGWWSTLDTQSQQPPTLQLGSTGTSVKILQEDLNKLGYTPALALDGDFGPLTQAAVKWFQGVHGLTVDGIVGPVTWAALDGALSSLSTKHDYKLGITFDGPSGKAVNSAFVGEQILAVVTLFDGASPMANQTVQVAISTFGGSYSGVPTSDTGYTGVVQFQPTVPGTITAEAKWTDPTGKAWSASATLTVLAQSNNPFPIPADDSVVAQNPIYVVNDAVLMQVKGSDGNLYTVQVDSGAFELMLTQKVADALKAPNLGSMTISGVGGQNTAYNSKVTLSVGGVEFKDIPCVVDTAFTGYPLFGFRLFKDNNWDLLISNIHSAMAILKKS